MPVLKVLDPNDNELIAGDFEVWMDPGPPMFEGLCIGAGRTREGALRSALAELTKHIDAVIAEIRAGRSNVEV